MVACRRGRGIGRSSQLWSVLLVRYDPIILINRQWIGYFASFVPFTANERGLLGISRIVGGNLDVCVAHDSVEVDADGNEEVAIRESSQLHCKPLASKHLIDIVDPRWNILLLWQASTR